MWRAESGRVGWLPASTAQHRTVAGLRGTLGWAGLGFSESLIVSTSISPAFSIKQVFVFEWINPGVKSFTIFSILQWKSLNPLSSKFLLHFKRKNQLSEKYKILQSYHGLLSLLSCNQRICCDARQTETSMGFLLR